MSDYEKMTDGQMTEESVTEVPATENTVTEAPVVEEAPMDMPMVDAPAVSRDLVVPEGNKKTPIAAVAAIIGVAVVAIIILVVCIFGGVFGSKKDKVLRAVANAFDESSKMVEEYTELCEFMLEDKYTMDMEIEAEGMYMDVQYAMTKDEKQIAGDISVEDTPDIEFLVGVTDSQLKAHIPMLSDYVFTYDYKAEKSGYLVDQMGEEVVDALDMMCDMIYSANGAYTDTEALTKLVKEEYDALEFESVEKKEYDVDGTSRKCEGYKTTITEENIVGLIDALEGSFSEDYIKLMAEMGEDMGEMFDEMRDDVAGMEDVELVFYIYKDTLACMSVEVDGDVAEILFGHEDGMLDMVMQADGVVFMELDGSVDGSVECYALNIEGEEMMAITYDRDNGDLELTMEDYGDTVAMRGSMKADSDNAVIEINEVEAYDEIVEMLCAITVSKGAELQEFEGEELDLGNATEDEIMEVVMGMYGSMY